MEQTFVGLDETKTANYKYTKQLVPIFYDNSTRLITNDAGETSMVLGDFNVYSNEMVYFLVLDVADTDFSMTISKGTTHSNKTSIFEFSLSSNVPTITSKKSYTSSIGIHKNSNELVIFLHYSPTIYYTTNPEYFYLTYENLDNTATANIIKESLFMDSFQSSFAEGIKNKSLVRQLERMQMDCDARRLEVSSTFDWGAFYAATAGDVIWTSWGQEDITFDYMEEEYPYITFDNLL